MDFPVIFIKFFDDEEVYWAAESEYSEWRKNKNVEFIINEDDEIIWDAKDAIANPGLHFCA